MKTKSLHIGTALVLAMLVLAVAGAAVPAQAITPTVLYDFTGSGGPPLNPHNVAIAQGRDGNLYTTSLFGGMAGSGTVFNITPSGTVTVVYDVGAGGGSSPFSGETLGTDGNFYGTLYSGGTNGLGEVYKLTLAGVKTVLHSLTGIGDGSKPYAPPIEGTNAASSMGRQPQQVFPTALRTLSPPAGCSPRCIRSPAPTARMSGRLWYRAPMETSMASPPQGARPEQE